MFQCAGECHLKVTRALAPWVVQGGHVGQGAKTLGHREVLGEGVHGTDPLLQLMSFNQTMQMLSRQSDGLGGS